MVEVKIKDKYRLMIVAPTSFFYQAPIYRELSASDRIDLMVLFCSEEGKTSKDVFPKFGIDKQWGDSEATLEGYRYKFLKNYSIHSSYLKWPFGLINLGVIKEVKEFKPDIVVIMSWVNSTDFISVLSCVLFGAQLFIMTDANIQAESQKSNWVKYLKKVFLGNVLFKLASGFLYAGTGNKQLYQSYGVPEKKLIPFAFSWESQHFLAQPRLKGSEINEIKAKIGISKDDFVILYCGRLSPEKAPMDLLKGYESAGSEGKALVFAGDGPVRLELEKYIHDNRIQSVYFMGFLDRGEINQCYEMADVLVLPSKQEATGAVLTEGMCFDLPIIASDQVGFGLDLVKEGRNGFVYPVGSINELAKYLNLISTASKSDIEIMGSNSRKLIEQWSNFSLAESLLNHLDNK